jgi:anaerobic ribonucleoside-triphosphate reductase
MEITKRFPQELGHLAEEREIATFPQPIIFVSDEKRRQKNERYEVNHVSHTKILTLPPCTPIAE